MANNEKIIDHIAETLQKYGKKYVPVLALSMGKDSILSLEYTIQAYVKYGLKTPLYVLYSDTLMGSPSHNRYARNTASDLLTFLRDSGLPIQFEAVFPTVKGGFWSRVLGRGQAQPLRNASNSWCSYSLKIEPMAKKVKELIEKSGKSGALNIVGVRKAESTQRATSITKHTIDSHNNIMESVMEDSIAYAPINQLTTEEVWSEIEDGLSFMDEEDIKAAYSNQTGENGSLRSGGCWYCPKSARCKVLAAEADIDPAMAILLKTRDELYALLDQDSKAKTRTHRKMKNGQTTIGRRGTLERGPYLREVREKAMRLILTAQRDVQAAGYPEWYALDDEDLTYIRKEWLNTFGELEDRLPQITKEVFGEVAPVFRGMSTGYEASLSQSIDNLPVNPDVDVEPLFRQLFKAVHHPLASKEEKMEMIKELIQKTDWRSEEKVLSDHYGVQGVKDGDVAVLEEGVSQFSIEYFMNQQAA